MDRATATWFAVIVQRGLVRRTGRMARAEIGLTVTIGRSIRRNAEPVVMPATARTIRTATAVRTMRHNVDPAVSVATVRRIIRTATAARTILRNAVPVAFTTVRLLTTWAAWAEIAVMGNRAMATAGIRSLILAAALRSLRLVAQIAVTRSRVIPRHPHLAAVTGVEAGQVAEAGLRGVPVEEAALAAVAEVVVRGAVVLRTVATKNEV